MIYIHPVFMVAVILLWLYVLSSGLVRLGAVHFGRKGLFPWKRHVALGKAAMAVFVLGWCIGAGVTTFVWSATGVTGWHWWTAVVMLGLLAVGFGTGLTLDAKRGAKNGLRLTHGLCNITLSLLALSQAFSGYHLLP